MEIKQPEDFSKEITHIIEEYNQKLNPQFTAADKEHIAKVCKEVLEQYRYEIAMLNNT